MSVVTFIFLFVLMYIYAYILISNSPYRINLRSLYNIISTTSFEQSMSTVTAVTTGNRLNPQRTPANPEPDHQLGDTTSSISSNSFQINYKWLRVHNRTNILLTILLHVLKISDKDSHGLRLFQKQFFYIRTFPQRSHDVAWNAMLLFTVFVICFTSRTLRNIRLGICFNFRNYFRDCSTFKYHIVIYTFIFQQFLFHFNKAHFELWFKFFNFR